MPFKLGGEIPKGHVKLPDPLTSDYLQASAATASSEGVINTAIDFTKLTITPTTSTTYPITPYTTSSLLPISLSPTVINAGDYIGASFSLDMTNYDTLTFEYISQAADSSNTIITQGIDLVVLIDGTQVATFPGTSTATSASIDISSYAGIHTIEFRTVNNTGSSIDDSSGTNGTLYQAIENATLVEHLTATHVLDEDTTTFWQPASANAGEYIYLDLGTPTILGGARIYWLDAVPNAYRLQASLDATNWTDVYTATSAPTANDWTEYSWYATYARYLRLYLDDQGTNPVKVAVFDYYSRITDRVAAEHGHGSGVEKWKKGRRARRGFHREKKLEELFAKKKKKSKVTKQDILEIIEELKNYIDFKVPD